MKTLRLAIAICVVGLLLWGGASAMQFVAASGSKTWTALLPLAFFGYLGAVFGLHHLAFKASRKAASPVQFTSKFNFENEVLVIPREARRRPVTSRMTLLEIYGVEHFNSTTFPAMPVFSRRISGQGGMSTSGDTDFHVDFFGSTRAGQRSAVSTTQMVLQ